MSIVKIACRSVFSCHRSRLPLCILNSLKWRNFAVNDVGAKVEQDDDERKVPVQRTPENYLKHTKDAEIRKHTKDTEITKHTKDAEIRKSPYESAVRRPQVNLTKFIGISVQHTKKENEHSRLFRHCLDESPDAEGFHKAVDVYLGKNKTIRRGHIDFIATGLKFIEAYGLEKESNVYDALMDVFPREKFVNRTYFDAAWPQMHPQIWLALDVLTKMEAQGIMPSKEIHALCLEIFGSSSMPVEKIERIWLWFSEYYDLNPYKLDEEVYLDRVAIIRAAIARILGNNDGTQILEISPPKQEEINPHKFKKIPEYMTNYAHFIISSQTETQKKYIDLCDSSNSMYIEGPTHMWVNHMFEEYFIMKTGQGELKTPSKELKIAPDEEREGVIVGVCFATKPYNETLQRWLTYMQEENPVLREVNVVFDVSDLSSEGIRVLSPD